VPPPPIPPPYMFGAAPPVYQGASHVPFSAPPPVAIAGVKRERGDPGYGDLYQDDARSRAVGPEADDALNRRAAHKRERDGGDVLLVQPVSRQRQ
jgi:hypothetical protein